MIKEPFSIVRHFTGGKSRRHPSVERVAAQQRQQLFQLLLSPLFDWIPFCIASGLQLPLGRRLLGLGRRGQQQDLSGSSEVLTPAAIKTQFFPPRFAYPTANSEPREEVMTVLPQDTIVIDFSI